MRRRNQEREARELGQEHRAIMKGRKASRMQKERMGEEEEDSDEDTEQIEKRIAHKYGQ